MQLRPLGRTGLQIAPLVFGGNVFGWTADEATSFRLLDAFLAAGGNAIDTADVYSRFVPGNQGGESETLLGKWFKARGHRQRVVLITKCGMAMGDAGKGLGRAHILSAVEASLRRLQTDYIDVYMAHHDDPDTPLEETLEAFAQLVRQGKARAIAGSNYTAPRLAAALATSQRLGLPRFDVLQPRYNLYARTDFEGELQELCIRESVAVIPYFALASGFLTGKYRSQADLVKSPRGPRVANMLDARGLRILAAMDQVAAASGATHAQIALAWLLRRPGVTAPIVSATSLEQLAATMQAIDVQLDAAAVARLDAASAA